MNQCGPFSISDFAKYSRTTRDTLLHYDKIGLLSPSSRGENSYRYYSCYQLTTVNVIRTLQQLGMSLEEINGMMCRRTPEVVDELFTQQVKKIDRKIDEWIRARKLLFTIKKTMNSAMNIDEDAISIQFVPAEAIILGDLNDYSCGRSFFDALLSFYQDMSKKYPGIDLNYYVWGCYTAERIKNGDWHYADRFYFYNPEGQDKRPAALYAIGYTRGKYGEIDSLYKRVIEHIDKNGFEICGNAYEEYPLNETCITDNDNYLIKVMITVREKGSGVL